MTALQLARLPNGYELTDGVKMHAELGDRFQIANPWFKKYVAGGDFVELRVDSTRFSAHPDAAPSCTCELCNEPAAKPVLCHDHPASFVQAPKQAVPSRGWGEQFWVRVLERDDDFLQGSVDNLLYESRLHGLEQGGRIVFHEDHILSVHGIHNEELLLRMNDDDLAEFADWVATQRGEQ